MVKYSIKSPYPAPGFCLPPAQIPLTELLQAAAPCLSFIKFPKFIALPVEAIVIYCAISTSALTYQPAVTPLVLELQLPTDPVAAVRSPKSIASPVVVIVI